jgi:hypothetical protein
MQYQTIHNSISKKVLNDNTGKLELMVFDQVKKTKQIRGGFRMTYKSYDQALLEIVKSTKDLEILLYIRDMFTYKRVENVLAKNDIASRLDITPQKVSTVIKRMTTTGLLLRVSRGVYRLNPFMFVPFRADAEELQMEWEELTKDKKPSKLFRYS